MRNHVLACDAGGGSLRRLKTDLAGGLDTAEAAARLKTYGMPLA
jgi:hypothetical protein